MSDGFFQFFNDWTTHEVKRWKRIGVNARGDVYEKIPQTIDSVMVEESRKTVLRADGTTVISNASIYCGLDTAALFGDKDRVELPSGRISKVVHVQSLDVYGLPGHGIVRTD